MKQALCIKTAALAEHFGEVLVDNVNLSIETQSFPGFSMNSLASELVSRDICETDTSTLQVIPYITLLAKIDGVPSVYVYSRGQVGEDRLSGKCSIGLGGHIEQADLDQTNQFFETLEIPEGMDKPTPGLLDYLTIATIRELQEEVGLDLNHVVTNVRGAMNTASLFYNNTDEVGKVHLGVSIALNIGDNPTLEIDGVEVVKGEWVATTVLFKEPTIELETWSKIGLSRLASSFNAEYEHAIAFYNEKLNEAVEMRKNGYVDVVTLEEQIGVRVTQVVYSGESLEPANDAIEEGHIDAVYQPVEPVTP